MGASRSSLGTPPVEGDGVRDAYLRRDWRAVLIALMDAYGDAVYRHCTRLLGDAILAADVHQAVFEQAYRDLPALEDVDRIRGWLFRIATHRSLDAGKARRRFRRRFLGEDTMETSVGEASAEAVAAPDSGTPAAKLERAQAIQALEDCLRELDEKPRAVLLLRFKEEMSFEDMAAIFGEKAPALRKRAARALPLLRQCLEGKGVSP
jgi:RNA polymerase sigma-70 factor (ECF subfamily)